MALEPKPTHSPFARSISCSQCATTLKRSRTTVSLSAIRTTAESTKTSGPDPKCNQFKRVITRQQRSARCVWLVASAHTGFRKGTFPLFHLFPKVLSCCFRGGHSVGLGSQGVSNTFLLEGKRREWSTAMCARVPRRASGGSDAMRCDWDTYL